jgi:hypothetical protein
MKRIALHSTQITKISWATPFFLSFRAMRGISKIIEIEKTAEIPRMARNDKILDVSVM